jgi:flagellar motor switch/type III secretory pathway protein FliN
MPARLCSIDGSVGFEIVSGSLPQAEVPEGTTRLSIEFGSIELAAGQISELSQIGAIWNSEIPLGQPVEMRVNEELVARATLSTYEGRFAISVL